MKKGMCAVFVLAAVCAAVSFGAATNVVTWAVVPHAVTEVSAMKRVESVGFAVRPEDGKVTALVRYTLLDASTNVIRTGTAEYRQAELAAKLEASGETLARLKAILKALAAP